MASSTHLLILIKNMYPSSYYVFIVESSTPFWCTNNGYKYSERFKWVPRQQDKS